MRNELPTIIGPLLVKELFILIIKHYINVFRVLFEYNVLKFYDFNIYVFIFMHMIIIFSKVKWSTPDNVRLLPITESTLK
jgi:hypothetical protein